MKTCTSCAEQKQYSDFYAHPKAADGLFAICKACHKKRMFERRRDDPSVRAYDRERAKQPHRIQAAYETSKRWRQKNPDAYRAQNAVNNALRDGKISRQPCAICSTTGRVHAHHKDYSKPLEVVWLCARCHHRIHNIFPELEGANKKIQNA